jgi:hypothetical protein
MGFTSMQLLLMETAESEYFAIELREALDAKFQSDSQSQLQNAGANITTLPLHSSTFENIISSIQNSDIIIAEISTPSTDIGYGIGYALSIGKLVMCFCQDANIDSVIMGNPDSRMQIFEYKSIHEVSMEVFKVIHSSKNIKKVKNN